MKLMTTHSLIWIASVPLIMFVLTYFCVSSVLSSLVKETKVHEKKTTSLFESCCNNIFAVLLQKNKLLGITVSLKVLQNKVVYSE